MADFLEVDNAEVFDGDMEEENIAKLKVCIRSFNKLIKIG